MEQILHNAIYAFRRKRSTVFLAFFFFLGFITGLHCFLRSEELILSLMHGCFAYTVSIVEALIGFLLPFLLSAFAVIFSIPWLIYLISFSEALVFVFVSLLSVFAFQPSGFLIRFLLLFGDIISLPIMYFFWYRWLSGGRSVSLSCFFLFISFGFLIGCVEYSVIVPFCAKHIIL